MLLLNIRNRRVLTPCLTADQSAAAPSDPEQEDGGLGSWVEQVWVGSVTQRFQQGAFSGLSWTPPSWTGIRLLLRGPEPGISLRYPGSLTQTFRVLKKLVITMVTVITW